MFSSFIHKISIVSLLILFALPVFSQENKEPFFVADFIGEVDFAQRHDLHSFDVGGIDDMVNGMRHVIGNLFGWTIMRLSDAIRALGGNEEGLTEAQRKQFETLKILEASYETVMTELAYRNPAFVFSGVEAFWEALGKAYLSLRTLYEGVLTADFFPKEDQAEMLLGLKDGLNFLQIYLHILKKSPQKEFLTTVDVETIQHLKALAQNPEIQRLMFQGRFCSMTLLGSEAFSNVDASRPASFLGRLFLLSALAGFYANVQSGSEPVIDLQNGKFGLTFLEGIQVGGGVFEHLGFGEGFRGKDFQLWLASRYFTSHLKAEISSSESAGVLLKLDIVPSNLSGMSSCESEIN